MENSQSKTNQEKRVNWIVQNWDKFRFGNYCWGSDYKEMLKKVVAQMKIDGVISKTTYAFDLNLDRMVDRARKIKHPSEKVIHEKIKEYNKEIQNEFYRLGR